MTSTNNFKIAFEPIKQIAPKTGGAFDVLFQLKTPQKQKTEKRAPLNVCFVADVSGSMNEPAGNKQDKETVVPGYWQLDWMKVQQDEPHWPSQPRGPIFMNGSAQNKLGSCYPNNWKYNKPSRIDAPQSQCPGPEYNWVPEQRYMSYSTKLERVKDAIAQAIEQLDKKDRFSIVVFSNTTRVVLEPGFASTGFKNTAKTVLASLSAGGGTALHDGWKIGAEQVCQNLEKGYINRVLLLTDGEANIGIKDSDTLSSHTNGLAGHNVSTSTFGVGSSYNEDLLQSMADAGDGQYYYLDQPESIAEKFEEEFTGLSQMFAKSVSFTLKSNVGDIVLLNELVEKDGKWNLPNGIKGNDQYMVFRLNLPQIKTQKELKVTAELSFIDLDGKVVVISDDFILPIGTKKAFESAIESQNVAERVLKLEAAKAKRDAMKALDSGNYELSKSILRGASASLNASAYSMNMCAESSALDGLVAMADSGDTRTLRKQALYESYTTTRSKP